MIAREKYQRASLRTITIHDGDAYVPLTKGYTAIIDVADIALVRERNWYADIKRDGSVYAVRQITEGGKRRRIRMHNVICRPPAGKVAHHINGDGIDNRRANLVPVEPSENTKAAGRLARDRHGPDINRSKRRMAHIRYSKRDDLYYVQIYIGAFRNEEAAIKARDQALSKTRKSPPPATRADDGQSV